MGKRVNLAALADDDYYDQPDVTTGPALASLPEPESDPVGQRTVPLRTVAPNPLNKRPRGRDDELEEIAETIKAHGVIQPLVVCSVSAYLDAYPTQRHALERGVEWVALIGNRRLRAARLAALSNVPIVVNDDSIASMYEVMLIENGQRLELPPALEAEAMAEALKSNAGSQAELARRIGKSPMYVSQRLALLNLIPELRALLDDSALTVEAARELGALPEAEQRMIWEAGPPYRRRTVGRSSKGVRPRSIRVSTPAVAAESIREKFSRAELVELVELLSRHLQTEHR